jgi:hypothetical protein
LARALLFDSVLAAEAKIAEITEAKILLHSPVDCLPNHPDSPDNIEHNRGGLHFASIFREISEL